MLYKFQLNPICKKTLASDLVHGSLDLHLFLFVKNLAILGSARSFLNTKTFFMNFFLNEHDLEMVFYNFVVESYCI